jgi:hypothetical protein
MIDSGASSEFIDPDFARRCCLTLTPSNRTVILANGSTAKAIGQVSVTFGLTAAHDKPAEPFTVTFTATPLVGYDAILGITRLERHDVKIKWNVRAELLKYTRRNVNSRQKCFA